MKNTLFVFALTLIWSLGLMTLEVNAQTCPNPSGCIYGNATVTINYNVNFVEGYSYAQADYTAGLNFNPRIEGSIYRTDFPETDLDFDIDIGSGSSVPAVINLLTTNFVSGKTYCNYTNYFAVRRSTGQISYIGYFQDCKTITVSPTPTPTPTPSPTPTPTPTPPPTPTPTPTPPPTVQVQEVGFTGDHIIRRFGPNLDPPQYIDYPDGSTPTWVRGGSNNNPVAYTKGTNPTAFAKFTITPTPSTSINALVRIKLGGNVITNQNTPVTLSGNMVNLSGIAINASALESQASVKKGSYNFDWEISFDNGQQWQSIGTSNSHIIYWTYAAPKGLDCNNSNITSCTFVNGQGQIPFPGLYDLALEKAIGELPTNAQTPEAIAKALAANVDNQFDYDPRGNNADLVHPLYMYSQFNSAQCSANANLLLGLLRSIGIDSETIYVWGGLPTNPENGGKVYVYVYRESATRAGYQTFKVERPRSNENYVVPKDPHFTFHAMVKLNDKYYDPSYGTDLLTQTNYPFSEIIFQEIVDLNNPNNPRFRSNNNTLPFIVKALTMRTFCVEPNCHPDTVHTPAGVVCPHSWQPPSFSFPFASFDDDRITDIAVWRPSDGVWYIKNSSDQTVSYPQFGQSGDQIVPGDYDGDGITDLAVFRPSAAAWYILQSQSQTLQNIQWETANDIPVSGDFDGDGKTDIAVYRPNNSGSGWYIRQSSNGTLLFYSFGLFDDKPVSADFDGDGKTDIAVFRPSNGTWYWLRSSDGGFSSTQFGASEDKPTTGDYDGDHKTDIAVFRPSVGEWHLLRSTEGYLGIKFGANGDVPVQGDYDEDGKTDVAVWTPANGRWRILKSSDSTLMEDYWGGGSLGDVPVPSAFNR